MLTDKKFDKLMKDAKGVLDRMPEAHNFAHRTIYNQAALTTSWYLEDSKMEGLMGASMGAWAAPNPVEKFVLDCEATIKVLVGALKEMADDYDSLEMQFNEYKDRQPDEKAKNLYDHVNGRGVHLIDILVDSDKAHIKMENDKLLEPQFTALEEAYPPPVHRTLDDWSKSGSKGSEKGFEIKIGDDGYIDQISSQGETAGPFRFSGAVVNKEVPADEVPSIDDWMRKGFEESEKSLENTTTAHWIEEEGNGYYCSACHGHASDYWTECPNCNAKMTTVTRDYGEDDNE